MGLKRAIPIVSISFVLIDVEITGYVKDLNCLRTQQTSFHEFSSL